ncbi:MAG: class I SAM-dependent methyltransferase [Nitriliruptoraceae bacterium]
MDPEPFESIRSTFAPEDDTFLFARERAAASARPPSPGVGSLLRWIAGVSSAHTAVEVGSAGGVSGLHLIAGLGDTGALTSLESDPHTHALAATAYAEAGIAGRIRSILGDPLTVLPRLSDGAYDLVVIQSHGDELTTLLEHAIRLLRVGGMLVVRGLTDLSGEVTGESLAGLLVDGGLVATGLPLDDGVLLAMRTTDERAED